MADPWTPPAGDQIVSAQTLDGHPLIIKPASPVKPEFIPGAPGQVFDPTSGGAKDIPGFKPGPPADKTSYRPMTPGEKTANHLSVDAPWMIGSTGEFKLPEGFKAGADKDNTLQTQDAIDAADALVRGVQKARGYINDGDTIVGNTATGGEGNFAKHLPWVTDASKLQAVIDQEIRGNIFLKRIGDLKQESDSPTGGTGIGRIMQAEIPLITGAIGTLDPGRLGRDETLTSLQQIERAALRSKARLNGEDPDNPAVQKKYGIPVLGVQAGGNPPAAPGDGPSLGGGTPGTPPENPIANGGPGDMGPSLSPSGGETRSVIDPKKQALGQQIVSLVSKGANPNTVMGFAAGVDPTLRGDPKFRAWVAQAVQYRQQHPNAKFSIDPGFYTTEAPLGAVEKVGNAVAQSGPGAAAMNFSNGVTAGNLANIMGDREGANRALAVANAQHPMASLAGSAAGGATAALGLDGALAKAGVAALPAAIGADMGYGAAAGATNAPNGQALQNGAIGALLGLGGNLAGRGIGKAAGAVAQGVTSPSVSYVAREVPQSLTIGQAVGQSGIVGKAVKGVEDRLSGIPVVGDAINARRLEGLQKMNSVAFDKALEPIGGKSAGKFGEQAVADAQDVVSQAFHKALGGKVASVDQGFIADAAKAKSAIKALPPSISKDVENHVDTAIRDYVDPNSLSISGENMQALLRDLQQVKKGYRSDPAGYRVGKAIDQMTDSIENLFRRQAPDVMPQYDASKQAFKRVSTLEDAVLRAKNTNGIFTPGQLGLADRANTVAYGGKHAAAAGKGEFHDFQRNMQEVLPNKVPDSGTAGRLVLPALAIGAGAGGGELSGNESTGLTLGGLIAAAYTRSGQRALTSLVLKRGASAKAVGNAVTKAAPVLGHAAGTQAALGAPRD